MPPPNGANSNMRVEKMKEWRTGLEKSWIWGPDANTGLKHREEAEMNERLTKWNQRERTEMVRKGEGVCSLRCHANEGGAAAMLTNSSSHCWTHHLLILPPPFPSLYPFISPLLSPGFSFLNARSLAHALAVARVCALTWQQLGRGRCGGMRCTRMRLFVAHVRPSLEAKMESAI